MDRLIDTPFMQMVSDQQNISGTEMVDIENAYKEFTLSVVNICKSKEGEIPIFFIIDYTRLELIVLKSEFNTEGAKKKCTN